MSGMPSTNSLHSLYNFVHVPWVQAQLSRIQARVGKDQFPIVKTTMLPNAASLRRYRDFPAIIISGNRNDARLRVRNREQVNTLPICPCTSHEISDRRCDSNSSTDKRVPTCTTNDPTRLRASYHQNRWAISMLNFYSNVFRRSV